MKIHLASLAIVAALGSGPAAAQSLTPNTTQPPSIHLDVYAVKPARTLAFTGTGFTANEPVDVSIGDQLLTTVSADAEGRLLHASVGIPLLSPGDYTLSIIGQISRTPITAGLKIDGVHPWVVLNNYYVSPQSGVGFTGEDFVPGEGVAVYLNSTQSAPVAQVTADSEGRIGSTNALTPANVSGDNQLIFVSQQSQVQLTATFSVASQ